MVPVRSPLLRLTLRQGSVYKMPHRALTSPLPHFLVVVNRSPVSDEVLLLTVVTSNIDLRREFAVVNGDAPETIVVFGPDDYAELDHVSCIDCNDVKVMRAEEFEQAVRTNPSAPCLDLPSSVLDRVVAGILASGRVRKDHKALVRPS